MKRRRKRGRRGRKEERKDEQGCELRSLVDLGELRQGEEGKARKEGEAMEEGVGFKRKMGREEVEREGKKEGRNKDIIWKERARKEERHTFFRQ